MILRRVSGVGALGLSSGMVVVVVFGFELYLLALQTTGAPYLNAYGLELLIWCLSHRSPRLQLKKRDNWLPIRSAANPLAVKVKANIK